MIWPFSQRKIAHEGKSLADPTDEEEIILTGELIGTRRVSLKRALSVPAVAAAVRTISEAAATLDVRVVRMVEDGQEEDDPEHPAARLLRGQVNGWTSGFELTRNLIAQALTDDRGGRAWVNRVDGKPYEVIQYRSGVLSVNFNTDTGEPKYQIGARTIDPADVIHVRNPFDKSALSIAGKAIAYAITLEEFGQNFFENGARPSGVVEVKKSLGLKGLKRFLNWFRQQFASSAQTGQPIVLDEDMTWKPFDLTSADSQYMELRGFQIVEIARGFNIPVTFLGDLSRATWSNLESKNREFLSYCLEPHLRALEAAYTRALFTEEERRQGYRVVIDRDDLTRVALTERATAIASLRASETITANEGRDWLDLQRSTDPSANVLANPNITVTTRQTGRIPPPKPEGEEANG